MSVFGSNKFVSVLGVYLDRLKIFVVQWGFIFACSMLALQAEEQNNGYTKVIE